MMHPQNVNSTMQRNDCKIPKPDPNAGLYLTYHLKPSILGAHGAPMQCNCGSQYSHAPGNAVEKFPSHYILALELTYEVLQHVL